MTGWIKRLHTRAIVVFVAAAAVLAITGLALAGTWPNTAPITINDAPDCGGSSCSGPPESATAYPSTIEVTGEIPNTGKVTATIDGFAHTFPDDVDILLVGPGGQNARLMTDAGGGTDVMNEVLTFDDSAPGPLPDHMEIHNGTYQPSNWVTTSCLNGGVQSELDEFNPPAPAGPYGSTLSVFNGTDPNGTWSLYIVDDCHVDSGVITRGWSLTITPAPTAVKLANFVSRASTGRIELVWRTGSEVSTAGYNLLRSGGGRAALVNRGLIQARGSGTARGAAYRLVDRHVRPGVSYTYRLQVVALDGSRSWAASTSLRAS